MLPKVSVIIAIYNVEDYIERCLHTLFGQTLDDIEYIFVNDGSPDASIDIIGRVLEQYPERKLQVKIIDHEVNKGIAAARTSGILAATGEYVIHCDPDDYIELDMYEKMYNEARKSDSDIVFCDFYKENFYREAIKLDYKDVSLEDLKRPFINIYTMGVLWNVLVKNSLIQVNKLLPFIGGDLSEDYALFYRILYFTKSYSHIPELFYHYCIRNSSITRNKNTDKFQKLQININFLNQFYKEKGMYKKECAFIKLNAKIKYRYEYKGKDKEWFDIYKETHHYALLMPYESLKTRMMWCILLSNYTIYRIGCFMYKFIKGKDME